MEELIGTINLFAGDYAPQGYAFCHGQIITINRNTVLFSIIGTTYGGNGTTTFALPDLRGRVPVGFGQSPGLSSYSIGETKGTENNKLVATNIPALKGTANLTTLTGVATGTVQQNIPIEIPVPCSTFGSSETPVANVMAIDQAVLLNYATTSEVGKFMQPLKATVVVNASASLPVTLNGGSVSIDVNKDAGINPTPINNIQPSLGLNYIICMEGVYPQRN